MSHITTLAYIRDGERCTETFEDDAALTETRDSARLLVDLEDHHACSIESVTLPDGTVLSGYAEVRDWVQGNVVESTAKVIGEQNEV